MAELGPHRARRNPPEEMSCCLSYKEWEYVAIGIIATAVFVVIAVLISLLTPESYLPLTEEEKGVLIAMIIVFFSIGTIVNIARLVCHCLASKKRTDYWLVIMTVIFSICVYCSFLTAMLFFRDFPMIVEYSSELRIIILITGIVGVVIYAKIYFMKEEERQNENRNENQPGGRIKTIARSFGTRTRRQNRVHQMPEEPSTSGLEINFHYPPRTLEVPSGGRSIRSPRNPNSPRSTVEAEVHRGPSTSRASATGHGSPRPVGHSSQGSPQQAQPFSSVETDDKRETSSTRRILFPKETVEADKSKSIMTRSKAQQLKRSISTERSQEIQVLPGQLEESGSMGNLELRRRRLEPIETQRQLRPLPARKTSKIRKI